MDWSIVVARSYPQPDDHRTRIAEWTEARARRLWPDAELVLWDPRGHGDDRPFHHAEALNGGARAARGDVLVLMDSDTFVPHEAIRPALDVAREGGWALARYYAQLRRDPTENLLRYPPGVFVGPLLRGPEFCGWVGDSCSWAGFVVIRRDVFLDVVQGYDERLSGWAPDDIGFGLTANALVAPVTRIDTTVFHLWHEPSYERDNGWTDEKHAVKNAYLAAADDPDAIRAVMVGKPKIG